MKKNSLFILLFMGISSIVFSQKYLPGKIKLKSGKVLQGLVKPPNDAYEKAIEYTTNESSEKIKHSSDEVEEVTVSIEGYEHKFVRKNVRMPKKKEPKMETDYRYSEKWLVVLVEGHTVLYAAGPLVKIKNDGQLRIKLNWNGNGVPPDIMFYLENEKLKIPTWTAFYSVATAGQMKAFKFWTTRHFADNTELVKRIENEEFNVVEIADVVSAYNNWKVKK